ncbi:unnamed protein product, partial [Iphiclides podalirius]
MAKNSSDKKKARFVAETEPYDDDLTQMEEERPTKRPCIEGNLQNYTEDNSMKVLFENDSQDWDDDNNNYQTCDISTNTKNLNLTESSTQTNTTDY